MAVGRALLASLCVLGPHAASGEKVELTAPYPFCRKSPEIHQLLWPAPSDAERLVIFGGKGYDWQVAGHGTHGHHTLAHNEEKILDAKERRREKVIDEMIYEDDIKAKVTMFGDTWAFDTRTKEWEQLTAEADGPVHRWKPSTTVVNGGRTLILFGGCRETNVSGVMNDMWRLDTEMGPPRSAAWTQVNSVNPPAARRGHVLAANTTHLVILGGKTWDPASGTKVLNDVWSVPQAALGIVDDAHAGAASGNAVWTRGSSFPGHPRWGSTGTVLTKPDGRQVIAYFGGRSLKAGAVEHTTAKGMYTYYNELWFYDFQADTWELQKPVGGSEPHPRDHHGAADINGDLYVFGGRLSELRAEEANLNDLWSYSTKTRRWKRHDPAPNGLVPKRRYMPGLAATSWGGQEVPTVFAGESLPGSTKATSRNDVWVYVPEHGTGVNTWMLLAENSCEPESVEKVDAVATAALPDAETSASGNSAIMYMLALASVALAVALVGATVADARERSSSASAARAFVACEAGEEASANSGYRLFA